MWPYVEEIVFESPSDGENRRDFSFQGTCSIKKEHMINMETPK
jgi:hypothetical protein